jgi:hypothetical protein
MAVTSAEALLSAPALCRQTTSHLTEDCVRRQSSCCCPIRSYTVPAQLRLLWRRDQCAEALKNPRETTQKDACWDALARSEPAVGSPTYALPAGSSQAGWHSSHLFDKSTTANSHQHRGSNPVPAQAHSRSDAPKQLICTSHAF